MKKILFILYILICSYSCSINNRIPGIYYSNEYLYGTPAMCLILENDNTFYGKEIYKNIFMGHWKNNQDTLILYSNTFTPQLNWGQNLLNYNIQKGSGNIETNISKTNTLGKCVYLIKDNTLNPIYVIGLNSYKFNKAENF